MSSLAGGLGVRAISTGGGRRRFRCRSGTDDRSVTVYRSDSQIPRRRRRPRQGRRHYAVGADRVLPLSRVDLQEIHALAYDANAARDRTYAHRIQRELVRRAAAGASRTMEVIMGKYVFAWLLGVPAIVLVLVYLVFH